LCPARAHPIVLPVDAAWFEGDMSEKLQATVTALKERFDLEASTFRGDTTLIVSPDKIVTVCQALRDEFGFPMLTAHSAVDYWPQQEPRFHLVYQVLSLEEQVHLGLRVPISGSKPVASTIEGIYPNANWLEREVFDMFGIRFEGHSDLRRIIMPHDWEGHPLRKDYPLGYEEVQFTFNFDEIDLRKPYAKE
jgi:NADH-quinone oxidoreductase subunit C